MDTFATLALATDPASEALLDHKPDKKSTPLFSVEMYMQILFQSTYQTIITLISISLVSAFWATTHFSITALAGLQVPSCSISSNYLHTDGGYFSKVY